MLKSGLFTSRDLLSIFKLKNPVLLFAIKRMFALLSFGKINDIYFKYNSKSSYEFVEAVLNDLDIRLKVEGDGLSKVPANKTFIVVCNHPFGLLDGLALLKVLLPENKDTKVLVHPILKKVKPLSVHFISVNPFQAKESRSISAFRQGKQLQSGLTHNAPLVVFPAGRVSSFSFRKFRVADRKWSPAMMKWLARSNVKIIPCHIEGRNSILFHLMNRVHENLGFLCIGRELFLKKGKEIKLHFDDPLELSGSDAEGVQLQLSENLNRRRFHAK